MTSTLTSPSTSVLGGDRAALVDSVADLLAGRVDVGSVAVVRAFDRASREARDVVVELVRSHGGKALDLTAASCAGGGAQVPEVDLVVAVSRSVAPIAQKLAETRNVPLLSV
jgi:hypothetical protein